MVILNAKHKIIYIKRIIKYSFLLE